MLAKFGLLQMEGNNIHYRRLFEMAAGRLVAAGISAHFSPGAHVTSADISRLEEECGISLPLSLRQFYLDIGDGLTFEWFIDRSDASLPFCCLKVPQVVVLKRAVDYLRMLNEGLADHSFHETQDPQFARAQYARQLAFFPIMEENADLLCIETNGTNEAVVFHDHEWSFYGHGVSGTLLAVSLPEFWRGWSSVGFVAPKGSWWPGTVGASGVEWSVERFGFSLASAEL